MARSRLEKGALGIWDLILERAPVNALTADLLDWVATQIAVAQSDAACRALVVRSGLKVFSAGMDLKQAASFDQAEEERIARAFTTTYTALYSFSKPMVCAVGGAAIAGGFFFPICADIRLASRNATFGLAEVRVGARLPVGALEIARAELAPADFRRLLLTGAPVSAETAARGGYLDMIVDQSALIDAARSQAVALADLPADAYAATKADLRQPTLDRITAALDAGAHAAGVSWFLDSTKGAIQRQIS